MDSAADSMCGLAMRTLLNIMQLRVMHVAVGTLLAALWVLFVARHVEAFRATGKVAFLIFCVSESIQAFLFLARKLPRSVSSIPLDWIMGISGTMLPLFFAPEGTIVFSYGEQVIACGAVLQILGLLSLNRSFAIIAARRTIKTLGMYRLVRHPIYASYLPLFLGYILLNGSMYNVIVCVGAIASLLLRIVAEERHLAQDPVYLEYKKRVRWRLLPWVY
jgi:protein-S-isoprenylcysteine O-methyltransferase Ste14